MDSDSSEGGLNICSARELLLAGKWDIILAVNCESHGNTHTDMLTVAAAIGDRGPTATAATAVADVSGILMSGQSQWGLGTSH